MSLRVRFAPSPTGYLHVGGARTALFNWLLARQAGGTFILRIEDTDRQRSEEAHTRAILDGLSWLGIDWDEGPHFQSEGLERHVADARRLLAAGKAYRDFTTQESLRAEAEALGADNPSRLAREIALAQGPGESERRAAAGEPHAIRFLVPEGETVWTDRVHGEMRFANADIEDLVILRSDGTPTYNIAVVSDDVEMDVSLVIRGDDHISNTPKQILLYEALGRPVPAFAHVPLILGPDGRRLSKRHGATAVGEYAGEGILPEALFNFLALLGWNPGDEREVMSRKELASAFSLERVQKKSAVFDVEKLAWLNGQYLARTPAADVARLVLPHLEAAGFDGRVLRENESWLYALVDLLRVRARTVLEVAAQARPFLLDEPDLDADAARKHWAREPAETAARLDRIRDRLEGAEWSVEALEMELRSLAEALGVGAGKLIHPLRVALTGQATSPGIFDVLVLLGRDRSLDRVARAAERVREMAGAPAEGA